MQVFKACLKIIRHNATAMMIYLGIFIVFVVMITIWNPQTKAEDFTLSKPRVTIINEDISNLVSEDLVSYLSTFAVIADIEDKEENLTDALFFRQTEYILRIPIGFGAAFLSGKNNLELIRTTLPDSYQGAYIDQLINKYLSTAQLYFSSDPNRDIKATLTQVRSDLAISANISVKSANSGISFNSLIYFFIFLAYSATAILILGVTSLMISFQNQDIKRRNFSSPLKLTDYNLQLILGNLMFALASGTLLSLTSLFFFSSLPDTKRWLLLVLNTFVFIFTITCMSFLLSQFIRSRGAQQAAANVVSLGTCFISGVFVPQEMLGDNVLAAASFTPTYWYIRAVRLVQHNEHIKLLEANNFTQSLMIQIAFATAFIVVALVAARSRRQST
ncbi:MAG: linearmycin/streptolysin transport system permease protein [Clostridiales bacterium]|nr:linearmycin/streptolysin transport system permease protein [Clostridiales bacterium]